MELWVRSQDKRLLCKVDSLNCYKLNGSFNISTGNQLLGKYSTEERCLEIIDEIQGKLKDFSFVSVKGITQEEFDKLNNNAYEYGVVCLPSGVDIVHHDIDVFTYQMPEN